MRTSAISFYSAVALGALGCGAAMPATAQTAPAAADPATAAVPASGPGNPASAQSGLQDIVVTARRSAENLQKVPLTVTALNSTALQQKAVHDIYDLQQATPSLTVEGSQSAGRSIGTYVIHGQHAAADDAPPGVVTYLNDVPVNGGEISRALFDMESVQVLKGPQGTLFGRNTNGGAILFNTVAPRDDFDGYITGRYGNYNDKYVEGAINIPVTDALAIRASGNIERRNGFTKNTDGPSIDNLRYGDGRISIRLRPNDVIDNNLVFNYTNINERGPAYILSSLGACDPANPGATANCYFNPGLGFTPGLQAAYDQQQQFGIRKVALAIPGTSQIKAVGVSDTLTLKLDGLTIKNIFGFHDQKFSGHADYDSTNYTVLGVDYNRHTKTLTDELQVQASLLNDKLKIIAGGFYLDTQEDPYCGSSTQFCATNGGEVLLPLFFANPQYEHRNDSSRALFAQASFKVTDTITVTGGYRYTWDRTNLQDRQFQLFFPGSLLIPFVPPAAGFPVCSLIAPPVLSPGVTVDTEKCQRIAHAKFAAGNYIGSVDWAPIKDVLAYATFRHGYKSGGFNSTSGFSGQGFIYDPEKVNDLEIGLKTQRRFGDVDVRFNVSGFHDWYKQLQLTSIIVDPTTGPQSLTQNVGAARLWGGEADLVVVPLHGLTLEGTFSYFDGKFTRGTVTDTNNEPVNLAGVKYRTQPKITYTLTGSYAFEIGEESKLTPSVFYTWRKGYYFNYDTSAGNFIPSYGLVNARLEFTNAFKTGIDIGAYAKNLTNKNYALAISSGQAFGYVSRFWGEPRTYGVEATIHFGARR